MKKNKTWIKNSNGYHAQRDASASARNQPTDLANASYNLKAKMGGSTATKNIYPMYLLV